jgi:hypothetical protein
MATPGTVLSTRVYAALRDATVATAAGINSALWAATDYPHIFRGLVGYMGGRNRGRLPFVEWDIVAQNFTQENTAGGTLIQTLTIRCHVGGKSLETAGNLCEAVLLAALVALRSEATDNLLLYGDDQLGELQPGPWGQMRDLSMTVEQSFSRSAYEVS